MAVPPTARSRATSVERAGRSLRVSAAPAVIMIGAEQMARSAVERHAGARHGPEVAELIGRHGDAEQRGLRPVARRPAAGRTRAGCRVGPERMTRSRARRQGAAPAMRAQPTRRGLGVPPLARRVITLPVVPQDTAATQTRASPRSIAPVVYGSGREDKRGDHRIHRAGEHGCAHGGAIAGRGLSHSIVHDARADRRGATAGARGALGRDARGRRRRRADHHHHRALVAGGAPGLRGSAGTPVRSRRGCSLHRDDVGGPVGDARAGARRSRRAART